MFAYVIINNSRQALIPFSIKDKFKDVKKKIGTTEKINDLSRIHLKCKCGCRNYEITDDVEDKLVSSVMNLDVSGNSCVFVVDIDVDITIIVPGQIVVKEKIKKGKTSIKEIKDTALDIMKKWKKRKNKTGDEDGKEFSESDLKICVLERWKYKKGLDYGEVNNDPEERLLYPFSDYVEKGLEKIWSYPPHSYYKRRGNECYINMKSFDDWGL
jgi:hypothetical protein